MKCGGFVTARRSINTFLCRNSEAASDPMTLGFYATLVLEGAEKRQAEGNRLKTGAVPGSAGGFAPTCASATRLHGHEILRPGLSFVRRIPSLTAPGASLGWLQCAVLGISHPRSPHRALDEGSPCLGPRSRFIPIR